MNNMKAIVHSGAALMDSTTFEDAFRLIYGGMSSPIDDARLSSLAQLVQALVIHDQILIEPISFDTHMRGRFSNYLQELGLQDLVKEVSLTQEDLNRCEQLALNRAQEIMSNLPEQDMILLTKYLDVETQRKSERIVHYRDSVPDFNLTESEIIAYRAFLYFAISCYQGVPYLPNVHRAPIIEYELRARFFYKTTADTAMKMVEQTALTRIQDRNQLIGQDIFRLEFPPIFNYVISRIKKYRLEVIPVALELRESSEAKAFRKLCADIDQYTRDGNLELFAKTLDEMQFRSRSWLGLIDKPTIDITIAFPLGVEFNPIGLLKFIKEKRKRYLIFLDRLFMEAANASELRSKFTSLDI